MSNEQDDEGIKQIAEWVEEAVNNDKRIKNVLKKIEALEHHEQGKIDKIQSPK